MALTKEDLQAIGELMDVKLNGALAPMRSDIEKLGGALAPIKSDLEKLNQTIARIEVDHGKKLGALYDAHVDTMRNSITLQELDAKVNDHGNRIFSLGAKSI